MKIFSLETKKHLIVWSMILGFSINTLVYFITDDFYYEACARLNPKYGCIGPAVVGPSDLGWPFEISRGLFDLGFWINFVFWFFVALIILSLVRWLKYRKKLHNN